MSRGSTRQQAEEPELWRVPHFRTQRTVERRTWGDSGEHSQREPPRFPHNKLPKQREKKRPQALWKSKLTKSERRQKMGERLENERGLTWRGEGGGEQKQHRHHQRLHGPPLPKLARPRNAPVPVSTRETSREGGSEMGQLRSASAHLSCLFLF